MLTDSDNPRNYWKVLKHRLKEEGNQSVTNCNQLKLKAADGKFYKTDVADQEQMFRIIQSIPSPKAEPFKLWMAHVASERIDQIQDPELSIQQALADYKRLGYSDRWITIECVGRIGLGHKQSRNLATTGRKWKGFIMYRERRGLAGQLPQPALPAAPSRGGRCPSAFTDFRKNAGRNARTAA